MKIGVICEGEKTDGPVIQALMTAEFPDIELIIQATTKAVIFQDAGGLIDTLFDNGCDRVVVVWDLLPVGTQMTVNSQSNGSTPCQNNQRKTLLDVARSRGSTCANDIDALLQRYGFVEGDRGRAVGRVALVCFSESFDAVFLSDPAFLQRLASSDIRQAEDPPAMRSPATVTKPQEILRRYFRRGHNKRLKYFNKTQHNEVLAREYIAQGKLAQLRRHPAYERLTSIIGAWIAVPRRASR